MAKKEKIKIKKRNSKIKEIKLDKSSLEKGIEELSKKINAKQKINESFVEEVKIETESKKEPVIRNVNLERDLEEVVVPQETKKEERQISYQGVYQGPKGADYQTGNDIQRLMKPQEIRTLNVDDAILYSNNVNQEFPQIKRERSKSLAEEFPGIQRDLGKEFNLDYSPQRRQKNPFVEEQKDKYNLPG